MTHYIQTDLDWMVGAKITDVSPGSTGLTLSLRLSGPVLIEDRECHDVQFEVWQDEEGNGPGHLALVSAG